MRSRDRHEGPPRHFSESVRPLRPVILILSNDPVIAAKPVAQTTASSGYSTPSTSMPSAVKRSIGVFETSTSLTCGRL